MTTTTYGQRIGELTPGQSVVLVKLEGGGSLEARKLAAGGVAFYWRYTRDLRTERVPIGAYDSAAPPKSLKPTARGYSVAAALDRARELAKQDQEVPGGLRAQRERDKAAAEAQERATSARQRFTLGALCLEYCDWLEKRGKQSHKDVRNIFANHLQAPYPDLWNAPAASVGRLEIIVPVRMLMEAEKATTARKLRAYLRAAYACALHADTDASLPAAFIAFGVSSNPVDSTAPVRAGGADKNPLTLGELRKYWTTLQGQDDVIGAALRLQLLTGGQRVAQLARLHRPEDVLEDALRLLDSKGKRTVPRVHLVPITAAIKRELSALPSSGFVLSTDGGTTPMHPTSISAWASEAGARAGIAGFQLKRVRSAIETELGRRGVPLHTRGQLQSHGLGGVQEKHYDAYDYLREKKQALEALFRLLEAEPAKNVTPLRRKRAA